MGKNIYKINKELTPYIRRILKRSFYEFRFYRNTEGEQICEANATPDAFRRITLRAMCEKADKETGDFHITEEESQDFSFVRALLWGRDDPGAAVIIDSRTDVMP